MCGNRDIWKLSVPSSHVVVNLHLLFKKSFKRERENLRDVKSRLGG